MAKKHPGGRPTVATPELVERATLYVEDGYKQEGEVIPTVEGLAVYLNIHRDTLYANEVFSDTLKRLKHLQGKVLINSGLKGDFNPMITRLVLATNHGFADRQNTDLTTKGKELPSPILGAMAKQETPDAVSADNGDSETS